MKDTITYPDFDKLDLRVGTITSAEAIPKSKKLLKLTINFGEEVGTRTVVAGIASLGLDVVGGKVVAIVNIAPREMFGIQSHGMILAAKNNDDALFLVSCAAKDGAVVG
jgi:methionyl-tRNA synthetase